MVVNLLYAESWVRTEDSMKADSMKAVVVDCSMLGSTQGMLVRGIVHNPLYGILVCTLYCHIPLLSVSIFLQSNYPSSPEHVGAYVLRRTRNSVVLLPFGTTVFALSSHPPSLHQLQPNFCCFPFTGSSPLPACPLSQSKSSWSCCHWYDILIHAQGSC